MDNGIVQEEEMISTEWVLEVGKEKKRNRTGYREWVIENELQKKGYKEWVIENGL